MQNSSEIEITEPRLFNAIAIIIVTAFSFFGVIPVFASFLIVSVMPLGILTFIAPLVALVLATCILPFASGNAYVTKLVRSLTRTPAAQAESFIVQLTLSPRIRSDLRA